MHFIRGASLVVQSIKNLPAVQETQVPSLGLNVYLEKEMATHSSTLSWKIQWTEESVGLQSMDLKESDRSQRLNHHQPPFYMRLLMEKEILNKLICFMIFTYQVKDIVRKKV